MVADLLFLATQAITRRSIGQRTATMTPAALNLETVFVLNETNRL
jgi:hypothetical protein